MPIFINAAHKSIFAETENIAGWLLREDAEALFALGYHHGDVLLEVGTYAGRSTVCMLAGALSAGRSPKYYGVDISDHAVKMTTQTLAARQMLSFSLLFHGTIKDFAARFSIRPTGVFIDAGHSYEDVAADIVVLKRMLSPKTPVLFHDYPNPDTIGVKRAVDESHQRGLITTPSVEGCLAMTTTTHLCEGTSTSPSATTFLFHKTLSRLRNLRLAL